MVVVGHLMHYLGANDTLNGEFGFLGRGVQLFYTLSGFILCELYRETSWENTSLWKFYIKRFFRIAPLFYATIITVAVSRGISFQDWSLHLTLIGFGFLPNHVNGVLGVEWSIHVECWMYVFFPLMVKAIRKAPLTFAAFCISVSFLPMFLMSVNGADIELKTFTYNQPISQIGFFAIGMYIALKHAHITTKEKSKFVLLPFGCALLAGPSVLNLPFLIQFVLALPATALLVLGFLSPRLSSLRIIQGLAWVGNISYSIYLIHIPIVLFLLPRTGEFTHHSKFIQGIVLVTCIILCSWITYHSIEKKGIELGRLLARNIRGK